MKHTLEELLVLHCSLTLDKKKPSSMFSYPITNEEQMQHEVNRLNKHWNTQGIYILVLIKRKASWLLLVFHNHLLQEQLNKATVKQFLSSYSYYYQNLSEALKVLKQHMHQEQFPHEVGVFLGYPLEDVKAFIEHKGKGYVQVGTWKKYHCGADA